MEPSFIEEVRLTAFKSFNDAVLPLDDFTLLVGRNGSGKSNALDGLAALSRLARDEDIRDAIGAGPSPVRGGVAGCPPFGESAFALGCSVRTGGDIVHLDVRVATEPVVQVVEERLRLGDRELLSTDPPRPDSGDIVAAWDSRQQDRNPKVTFRASRLLATQVLARIPATSAGQRLHLAAAQVLAALRSVFVLDPVPYEMRQYVPERDTELRRDAENLSAAVGSLLQTSDTRDRILSSLSNLNEQDVVDIRTSKSDLGDVMVSLVEHLHGRDQPVSARLISDGSLRFLAILVALLQAPTVDTMPEPLASEDALGQTTLVVEELENGLHASQAEHLVSIIREEVAQRRIRALATGHSPALLDALSRQEHPSVVICQRDREGASTLTRLVDLPEYLDVIASGGLGAAAVHDKLRARPQSARRPSDVLDDIFGAAG